MTALERLRELEENIARAGRRQRELREAKEIAVRDVAAKREALVGALAEDLDGSAAANTAQKALQVAEKRASEPWTEKAEAASRLVEKARQKRAAYINANIDALISEMSVPALDWPERARAALDALDEVAREYSLLGNPIEQLAREAGRPGVRVPINPFAHVHPAPVGHHRRRVLCCRGCARTVTAVGLTADRLAQMLGWRRADDGDWCVLCQWRRGSTPDSVERIARR